MTENTPIIDALKTDNRVALIVAGMHRSGTSAATRALSLLGAELPSDLMARNADNPKGFWESNQIVGLNDEILRDLGSSWDDPLVFFVRPGALATDEQVLLRMGRALAIAYPTASPIVLKDPRLAVLLDPWLLALQRSHFEPRLVISVRNPLEVAASLSERNGFSIGRSLLLWLSYFLAIERSSRGLPRVFIQYSDLLSDWRAVMRRAEKTLCLQFSRWTPAGELEIDRFLSRDDRHHHTPASALAKRADVPEWVKQAYQWATCAAMDAAEPDRSVIDGVAASYGASLSHFAPLIAEQNAAVRGAHAREAVVRGERDVAIADAANLRVTLDAREVAAGAIIEATHGAYRQSTSWRLTTPVRLVGAISRRIWFLLKNFRIIVAVGGGLAKTTGTVIAVFLREGFHGLARRWIAWRSWSTRVLALDLILMRIAHCRAQSVMDAPLITQRIASR